VTYGGTTVLPLISMPEIAGLAGVRRPVVTTWRRRHADFPQPVSQDGGRPMFDAGRVVDWLVDTGRAERAGIEPDLRLHLLASLAAGQPARGRGGAAPRALVAALTALVCLRHLDDEPLAGTGQGWRLVAGLRERAAAVDPDGVLLRGEVDALGPDQGWLAGAVDELVEAAWGCHPAYERIMATRSRWGVGELDADALSPAAAELVAGLSGAREHADRYGEVCVADPSAGAGDLLVAVLDRLGEDAAVSVVAAEADPFLARLLRRRLTVRGLAGDDLTVHTGPAPVGTGRPGGWPDGWPEPDVLVTRMPYRPKEQRGGADPFAVVRDLTGTLAPGRTAVVLGPADLLVAALPPYRPAARSRNDLLEDGRVEAVVALPGGLVPYRPAYQTGLWVLRREDPSPWRGRVLLADVSGQPLTGAVVDTLVWDVTTWRRHGHRPDQHLRAHAAQVAVSELTQPRVPLTTVRPRRPGDLTAPRRAIAQVVDLEADLALRGGLAARDEPLLVPRRTIGALVRDGFLVMGKGSRLRPGHTVADGHHRVIGAPELAGAGPVDARTVDRGVLAHYRRLRLTEPGDVVVTLVPKLGGFLDREGYAVVEFPARVLRIRPDAAHRLTPAVLAAALAALPHAGHATTRAAGAVRAPTRLVDVPVPLLPASEVERLDGLLAAAEARRERARREIAMVDELCRIATTGLMDGTLTMAGAPSGASSSRPDRPDR
jgi:hypothetical protein